MKPWIRFATTLYPVAWRRRYGAEFVALLEDIQPGARDFLNILRGAILMHFKMPVGGKVLAATALAGLAVAVWFAIRTPDQYVSTAVMQFPAGGLDEMLDRLNVAQQHALSRSSLTRILVREDLYQHERQMQPLEDIIEAMRYRDTAIRSVSRLGRTDSLTFSLQFRYPDRKKAQAVTRDLTSLFSEETATGERQGLQVLDPPSLPSEPVGPRRSRIVVMGMLGGLAAGILLLGARRWPLVAACGAGAAAVVFGGSCLVPDRYVSTAVLTVTDHDSAARVEEALLEDSYLRGLIQKLNLYSSERAKEPMQQVVQEMRNRDIAVRVDKVPQSHRTVLVISCLSDASPAAAQAVARDLVSRAIDTKHAAGPAGDTAARAVVLDPPDLPQSPVSPNRTVVTLIGLFGGLLLGIAWALLRRSHTSSAARA